LHQNPDIYAEGNSAVCQLMWDMQQSCQTTAKEQLDANYRHDTEYQLVKSIPDIYYQNTTRPIVIDKCRSWTLAPNQDLLRRYITDQPKTIVLTRPVNEIIESFASLHELNNKPFNANEYLEEESEPLMRSMRGVEWAKQVNEGEFLFISYKELVDETNTVLDDIYRFIGVKRYEHDLNNIINMTPENDGVYGLIGMHDVRPTIGLKEKV
jgi:hypothetical protein